MKASQKLGRVAGIDLYVHVTFWLFLAWIGVSEYLRDRSIRAVTSGVGFVLLVFGTVVLHELGHALTARRYGIKTRDITLYPTGGVARLERMPDDPREELWVALAGPAVNVALATVAFVVLFALGASLAPTRVLGTEGSLLARFAWVNVTLAIFNLLPAFPMDGGRVLRALLAMKRSYVDATRTAAAVGRIFAVGLGILGLMSNPMLLVIAVFVWTGAGAEAAETQAKAALSGLPVRAAMVTDAHALGPTDTLGAAAERMLSTSQVDFPVVDEHGRFVGMLFHDDLIVALASDLGGRDAPVARVMRRDVRSADPSESLEQAVAHLYESESPSIPVLRDGKVHGLLSLSHIGDLLMVRGALREHDARMRTRTRKARPEGPLPGGN